MLIADIDGCIVNNYHRQKLIPTLAHSPACWEPFNSACINDSPVLSVVNLVKELSKLHNNYIHFVTSRGQSSYEPTMQQLNEYFSDFPFKLYMRPMSDNRHTSDYKRSVFANMPLTKDSIIIDDHPDIIAMVEKHFSYVRVLLVESHDCTVSTDNNYTRFK
jgi:hypothetical protein